MVHTGQGLQLEEEHRDDDHNNNDDDDNHDDGDDNDDDDIYLVEVDLFTAMLSVTALPGSTCNKKLLKDEL